MVHVDGVVMLGITWTMYIAVSVHGSQRLWYNGAAVYLGKFSYLIMKLYVMCTH